MIGTFLISGATYIFGVVNGIYLREHNVVTVADVQQGIDKLVATFTKRKTEQTQQSEQQ